MTKPIELIYSTQAGDFLAGRAYSNPRFFSTPRTGVSKVLIVGEWPKIVAAYEAMGVPVERLDAQQAVAEPEHTRLPADLAEQIAETFPASEPATDEAASTDGLTKPEIIADLEAMNVDFDPRARKADLLALRDEARAIRDA